MKPFEIFDAVRIVSLPEGRREIPPYYSATGVEQIRLGDVGVVLGGWPRNRIRVEAVNAEGGIAWQDHFEPEQLERLPATSAVYSQRRINEHWACQLGLERGLLDEDKRREALSFARKVMAFARRNVDTLVERLQRSGYQFANKHGPHQGPDANTVELVAELASQGMYVPVALEAWLLEVGGVDLCGSHPDWPRTGYAGLGRGESHEEPWYIDPLVIACPLGMYLDYWKHEAAEGCYLLEIAPDVVHKANISGGAPVAFSCKTPAFDACLINQPGSFTLFSYLRFAFEWSGFPGFAYIPDAPRAMLNDWGRGLTRL